MHAIAKNPNARKSIVNASTLDFRALLLATVAIATINKGAKVKKTSKVSKNRMNNQIIVD